MLCSHDKTFSYALRIRATLEERTQMCSPDQMKKQILAHIVEVRAERKRAIRLAQECSSKSGWVFQYDDKCGSEYLHLPFQVREAAATQSRYKYRFGLHGNLAPGLLLQYSFVPPCLITGKGLALIALSQHVCHHLLTCRVP